VRSRAVDYSAPRHHVARQTGATRAVEGGDGARAVSRAQCDLGRNVTPGTQRHWGDLRGSGDGSWIA
jgi:hypothetical protein